MKYLLKLSIIGLLFSAGTSLTAGNKTEWRAIKKKHFIIYYLNDSEFADRVGREAESYYSTINRDLGFTRHDGFWLWDNRATIYIYRMRESFVQASGAPQWAAGKANASKRLIATYHGSEKFIDSVLPHEMTHLIFMEFMGLEKAIPLWLNEGVAQWEDKSQRNKTENLIRLLYKRNRLIPLEQLMRLDVRTVDDEGVAIVFYAEAVSVVGFIIKEYGADRFRKFCGQLRDEKSINDALRFTYPKEIYTIGLLEKSWHNYLKEIK